MSMIECESLYGHTILLPKDRLTFRPSAYGIVVEDGRVLLLSMRSTGKYAFPGGGVAVGERIEDALRREVREETGIEIKVVKFLHFEESFFYFDPSGEAWHSLLFFFLCRPLAQNLLTDHSSEDDEEHNPHWVDLLGLAEEDFHVSAGKVLQLVREEIEVQ